MFKPTEQISVRHDIDNAVSQVVTVTSVDEIVLHGSGVDCAIITYETKDGDVGRCVQIPDLYELFNKGDRND